MADLNTIGITGRLTRDAESRVLPTGTTLVEFDVANNTGYGDHAKVHFFRCSWFGKSAEGAQKYLTKGKQIAVSGQMQCDTWKKEDGTTAYKWYILVSVMNFLNSGRSEQTAATTNEEDVF